MGGAGDTVMAARYRPDTFEVDRGASFKMILDVGAWDESIAINAPGQSGDPSSRHYDDLAPHWIRHEYVPLLYSRAAVEREAALLIQLAPASLS
jgi:penicillin G amidase